jgi:putative hydrolases of HD superfamily
MLKELNFIRILDDLKGIQRAAYVLGGERNENSAEHSWHVATAALVLERYANDEIDILRVIKMLLVHDIVEIRAGDTILFDDQAMETKAAREALAATELFGMMPQDTADELRYIWEEFESGQSADALFANAIDRLMPILLNHNCEGKAWRQHGVSRAALIVKSQQIKDASEELWGHALTLVNDGFEKGWLTS